MLVEYNTMEGEVRKREPSGPRDRQTESKKPTDLKEMTMNTFANALYRDLTCGVAATVITVVLWT